MASPLQEDGNGIWAVSFLLLSWSSPFWCWPLQAHTDGLTDQTKAAQHRSWLPIDRTLMSSFLRLFRTLISINPFQHSSVQCGYTVYTFSILIIVLSLNLWIQIVFIMADDLGWGNVGYHNFGNKQIRTTNMDYLVKTGLELNRMYVYRGCAPTRSSFQTGRLPIHVTTSNGDGISDPNHGIPQEMTVIASKLRSVGYKTHLVGKWDAGFATWQQLPIFRGYDYFYGYLGKTIDYFDKTSINDCRKLLCFVYQLIPICHFVTLSISCIN